MKITVSFEVEADLAGWAGDREGDALTALAEIVTFLRQLNPIDGQSFLTLAGPVRAVADTDEPRSVLIDTDNGPARYGI